LKELSINRVDPVILEIDILEACGFLKWIFKNVLFNIYKLIIFK